MGRCHALRNHTVWQGFKNRRVKARIADVYLGYWEIVFLKCYFKGALRLVLFAHQFIDRRITWQIRIHAVIKGL